MGLQTFTVDGREFFLQIASDVIRDGIGVELVEGGPGSETVVLEIFRNDAEQSVQLTAFEKDIPLEAVEKALERYHREIPAEFDP